MSRGGEQDKSTRFETGKHEWRNVEEKDDGLRQLQRVTPKVIKQNWIPLTISKAQTLGINLNRMRRCRDDERQ